MLPMKCDAFVHHIYPHIGGVYVVMESNSPNIWVLLLQPKAYNRVSPSTVLKKRKVIEKPKLV